MELRFYRYRLNSLTLTFGKATHAIKRNRMLGLTCINTYLRNNSIGTNVSNRTPLCMLTLNLEAKLIKELFRNKDSSKAAIDIAEISLGKELNQIGADKFIQGTFDIIPVKSEDNYMLPEGETEKGSENIMTQLQVVHVYMYRKDVINYMNQEASFNLHNVSKAAALETAFRIRNIPPRTVIATPPQDNGSIVNCTVPMNTLIQNIDALNEYYGLYTCTPLIYWDFLFNEAYCINRFEPNIKIDSKTSFDTVQFRMHKVTDPRAIGTGSLDSLSDKMHLVALNSVPIIHDVSKTVTYTKFSTITTVNTNTGKVTKETVDKDSTKNRYVVESSPFTKAQFINNELVPSQMVAISITDASLRIFRPYKTYRFDADPEYADLNLTDRKFRIAYYGFELKSDGDQDFVPSAEISLYAVDKRYRAK